MQEVETFGPEFESVAGARAFVRNVLRRWRLDALEPEASVLVTELCSNSVLHARSAYAVAVSCDDDKLRIGVRDGSQHVPVGKARTRQAMTGRGLVLVEAYADEWGVDRHEDGKTVWVELVIRSGNSRGAGGRSASAPSQRPAGRAAPTSAGTRRPTAGALSRGRAVTARGAAGRLAA